LKDLCEFENGDRGTNYPNKSARTVTGIPFINAGHLTEAGLDFGSMDYISRERFELLGAGKVQPGDILFCLRGSLGKFASVGDLQEGAIASSLVIVRPTKAILPELVLAYFRSHLCAEMILKFANGAAQPNLSSKNLGQFIMPVPPAAKQREIVEIFEKVSKELATLEVTYEEKNRKLEELKTSILDTAFTGRLRAM
jgi:type I restriction enzyme S subunit